MRRTLSRSVHGGTRRQGGFTLIELAIAILIGLFLLGGLLTVTQNNRRAFANQSQLAQLQDEERTAMTMITDIVQAAGYFPNPTVNTAATEFPVAGAFATAGQYVAGSGAWGAAAPGDSISVRFATSGVDGLITCTGNNPGAGTYTNTFSVSNGQLVCSLNGAAATPLVGVDPAAGASQGAQIYKLQIRFGVKRNAAAAGNNVDTYVDAANMAAGDWNNVISVAVQLTFVNPLFTVAGAGQQQYLTFTRVVDVMGAGGIHIS